MHIKRFPGVLIAFGVLTTILVAGCTGDTEVASAPSPEPTASTVSTVLAQTPTTETTTAARVAPSATPIPIPTPNPFLGVPGIIDPTNFGWPREVEGLNGRVTIPEKPQRIITASVGHDETTLALVPVSRLVGVGGSSKNEEYSTVAHLVENIPLISRDPEVILARNPDVVVTSPFMSAEIVDALARVGVPVVQTAMGQSPEARIHNILLIGYIYGEEDRAIAFADELRARLQAVTQVALAKPEDERLRVLVLASYSDKIYTAAADSTEGGIIDSAGGRNVAAEAGLTGNPTISVESVIAMAPDLIIIPQPADGAEAFKQQLLANPALAEVPAIKNGRVVLVEGKHYTTLSYLNLRGVEDLAKTLWPDDFADREFGDFSLPK